MQQKIKELYEKALEQNISNNMAWEDLNPEKFAELIIRECMSQIKEMSIENAGHDGSEYSEGFESCAFLSIRKIEEHFGVKE